MRELPHDYRTASADGSVIAVYYRSEQIGEVKADSTEREDLLAAEEKAAKLAEKHAAKANKDAEAAAARKQKPARPTTVADEGDKPKDEGGEGAGAEGDEGGKPPEA